MRVGFFGGSFDPPHNGHLAVAQAAARAFALDTVLLVPSSQQPLKPSGADASYQDRLAMVRLLCAGEPGLKASELESPAAAADGNAPGPNYTIDTLRRLRAQLAPADEIFVVVGIDAFLDLERWRDPRGLLAAVQWIVVARPEFPPEQLAAMQLTAAERARIHTLDLKLPVSATEIRRRLLAGEDCSEWLPPGVLDYIRRHKLYKKKISFTYMSGEEIRKGDQVLFHGEPGKIDFIADPLIVDPDTHWYVEEFGGGVMVLEPKFFGSAFLSDPEGNEDLELVSRAAEPPSTNDS